MKRKLGSLDTFLVPETKKAKTDLDLPSSLSSALQAGSQRPPKIAIIGTAGRKTDSHNVLLSSTLFDAMVSAALRTIQTSFDLDPSKCDLISGGAAWAGIDSLLIRWISPLCHAIADHVAVQLFLTNNVGGLTIYSPCAFENSKFADKGSGDWKTNPGKSANYYHSLFTKKIGRDTMAEITTARDHGAIVNSEHVGFHARNDAVASKATHMIAFTWSDTGIPSDGGTLYTWNQCQLPANLKVHISLRELSQSLRVLAQ